jgi:hypothetical protein
MGVNTDGSKFMQSNSAYAASDGWQKSGSAWKYYKSGKAVTGWLKSGGKWYNLGTDGKMLTGWQKISGKWYNLGSDGTMVTGWQKSGGKWYLHHTTGGHMLTGWQKSGGKWYLLESSGKMLTGWQTSGGKGYYLGSDGKMRTGTQTIGAYNYSFNSSGVNTAIGGTYILTSAQVQQDTGIVTLNAAELAEYGFDMSMKFNTNGKVTIALEGDSGVANYTLVGNKLTLTDSSGTITCTISADRKTIKWVEASDGGMTFFFKLK